VKCVIDARDAMASFVEVCGPCRQIKFNDDDDDDDDDDSHTATTRQTEKLFIDVFY